jgi:hypothetical protein
MSATGTPAGERLVDIIGTMVHGGVNARRTLARGLIITYLAPEPDTPREQARWSLTAARVGLWPDDQELKIVRDCLYHGVATAPVGAGLRRVAVDQAGAAAAGGRAAAGYVHDDVAAVAGAGGVRRAGGAAGDAGGGAGAEMRVGLWWGGGVL